ncbi:DUF6664 family protein [Paenibacillus lactis]|uniref:DUF6664 family protein n=1 Tax=Paenibacillus lactis TaxID=228574 RepID=UPI00369F4687
MESMNVLQMEAVFDEIENRTVSRLRANEEAYARLLRQRNDLKERHPFVQSVLEGGASVFPSAEDHQAWLDYKRASDESDQMERMALYFQGHADCYTYLRKIGALR